MVVVVVMGPWYVWEALWELFSLGQVLSGRCYCETGPPLIHGGQRSLDCQRPGGSP